MFCLPPSVGFWDTAELQTVPYILGIAHPPGFPVVCLVGWAFTHLLGAGEVAWRMSLLCALAMSLAAWLIYRISVDQGANRWCGSGCAWLFAFGNVAWTRGTRAEVHAFALGLEALALWLALRWQRDTRQQDLIWCAFVLGLAAATHPVVIWIVPGMAVLIGGRWRSIGWHQVALAILAFVGGLLPYVYMPWRSAVVFAARLDPTLALGLPAGRPFWDYGHPATLGNFFWMVSGAQFEKSTALLAVFDVPNYFRYASIFAGKALAEMGAFGLLLAAAGVVATLRSNKRMAAALLLIAFVGVPFALTYDVEIDRDRYLLTAFWTLSLLAAFGSTALVNVAAAHLRKAWAARLSVAAVLAAALTISLDKNAGLTAQRFDRSGERFIARILAKTPPDAIIVTPWVYATPLGYAAYVQHRLSGRTVVTAEPKDIADRFYAWSRKRPVYIVYYETPALAIPKMKVASVDSAFPALLKAVGDYK